jgi:hypothetical protein
MNAIDRAEKGAADRLIDKGQKRNLILAAREAFERLVEAGELGDAAEFDSWRHHQQKLTIEVESLTRARNSDYHALLAHFHALAGRTEAARRVESAARVAPRNFALAKLRHEFDAARDVIDEPERYIEAIAKCRFKTPRLDDLTEKQVWGLVFDLRRNAQRRRGDPRVARTKGGRA